MIYYVLLTFLLFTLLNANLFTIEGHFESVLGPEIVEGHNIGHDNIF